MHCNVIDHRRHCCRLLKKIAGSPNSARRARSDSCIRQCGPSTTARLCLQYQLTATIRRWLYSYMQNRRAKVDFCRKQYKSRKVKTALFNYYLADFPTPPPNVMLTKYADDITIYTSGPEVADLINGLIIYLSHMLNYINNKKLTVSTAKSTVILFTPDTHEHHIHPQVKLADQVLSLQKKPKVLGVRLDTHLTFTLHCNNIAVRMQQRNNMLKALVGFTWGCNKETLLATIKAIGRSIQSYCCPVWTPSVGDTIWSRLQRAQYSTPRITTGCLNMADVAALHQETRELPVHHHDELNIQEVRHYMPSITTSLPSALPQTARCRIDDLRLAGLNLTYSNTSPKSHLATPAKSRQSVASTKIR